MKNLTLLFFFLTSFSVYSQKATISGAQKNCENVEDDSRERYLSIIHDGTVLFENVETRFGEFKIKGLKEGLYKIRYTNIFGQMLEKEINLTKGHNSVIVCVDEFRNTNKQTLFGNLKEGDDIVIRYSSSGCSHTQEERIEVSLQEEKLIGKLFVWDKLIKRTKIDLNSIKYLEEFEKKANQIGQGFMGCTTEDTYVFMLNNEQKYFVTDSSCDWDGYSELKREIFNYNK